MKTIKLSGKRGDETIVDDEDYEWLNKYKWHKNNEGYVRRSYKFNKKSYRITMHFNIMYKNNEKFPFINTRKTPIDHINRNRLDNRKENLRICSPAINTLNSKVSKSNTLGYKGIIKDKYDRYFVILRYKENNKTKCKYAGLFNTPEKAAIAYNNLCFSIYHDYTLLNIIPGITKEDSIIMPETLPKKMKRKPNIKFRYGYRGVYKSSNERYAAHFYYKNKDKIINVRMGRLLSPEDAARAYNAMSYSVLHDYSLLNDIPGLSKEASIIMPMQLPKNGNGK